MPTQWKMEDFVSDATFERNVELLVEECESKGLSECPEILKRIGKSWGLQYEMFSTWKELGKAVIESRKKNKNQSTEETVEFGGGKVASSKIPDFHLIPTIALVRLAERFELGQKKKKGKAWNACSESQEVLTDKNWAIERLSHVIYHALKLRDKLARGDLQALQDDDDASAIAWGGCFLIAATDALINQKEKPQ